MKSGSRLLVGFHRLGIVLATPFLVGAIALAVLQWHVPTGPLAAMIPDGAIMWSFGDDNAGKQIVDEQRSVGLNVPNGMMVVGLPLGRVRHENADWVQFELSDGRKITIGSTDSKKSNEIARKFLLAEVRAGHKFTEPIEIDGVRVEFVGLLGAYVPLTPVSAWQHKQRDWTWALVALCFSLAAYILMRAIGWVIDGFAGSHPVPDRDRDAQPPARSS